MFDLFQPSKNCETEMYTTLYLKINEVYKLVVKIKKLRFVNV